MDKTTRKPGFERNRPRYESSAEECRQRGFKAGDRLIGDEGWGPTVIGITAIGETLLLAKPISYGEDHVIHPYECAWTLDCRDWEKISDAR